MPGNCGRIEPMHRDSNESDECRDFTLRVAYTECVEGAVHAEPAVPAEDVQDSLNATV
jgi:hypothetical protein